MRRGRWGRRRRCRFSICGRTEAVGGASTASRVAARLGAAGHHAVRLYGMTDNTPPREWDAATYDTVNAPMTARGNDAVARLSLAGDETVLDAGCGTGQVTAT